MKKWFTLLLLLIFSGTYAQDGMPSADEIRAMIAQSITDLNIAPEPVADVHEEWIIAGKDSIQVRIYKPSKEKLPVLYHIHGGAMVAGDLQTHDNICRYLANHVNAIVVAVHYRRPPESKFPAAFDDSYTTLKWINANMKKLNGNGKLVILGDSAGGQLGAAVALANSKEKKPVKLLAQVLINPALSVAKDSDTYAAYPFMVEWYINPGDDRSDARLSPLLATDVSKVPPAIIVVCEKDELRKEGEAYHQKLQAAKISSTLFLQPETGHLGQLWCATAPEAQPAMDFVIAELKKVL